MSPRPAGAAQTASGQAARIALAEGLAHGARLEPPLARRRKGERQVVGLAQSAGIGVVCGGRQAAAARTASCRIEPCVDQVADPGAQRLGVADDARPRPRLRARANRRSRRPERPATARPTGAAAKRPRSARPSVDGRACDRGRAVIVVVLVVVVVPSCVMAVVLVAMVAVVVLMVVVGVLAAARPHRRRLRDRRAPRSRRTLGPEPAQHVLDHVVAADADGRGQDLRRQVPVADVPGEPDEVAAAPGRALRPAARAPPPPRRAGRPRASARRRRAASRPRAGRAGSRGPARRSW